MPKKLFAVTNIKGTGDDGGKFYNAGEEVDTKAFSKEQLRELLDAGAVEIRESSDSETKNTASPTDEELDSEVMPTPPDLSTVEDPAMKVENENDNP
jgi:hypothetical protein